MHIFLNVSKTTEAAILIKEKSREKERGGARKWCINSEVGEVWLALRGYFEARRRG